MNQTATAPIMNADLNEREPHELTFEQFASQARATKLDGKERKWSVALPGRWVCFSDADTTEDALKDAHAHAVRLALFLNAQNDGEVDTPSLPPAAVLAQYPDEVARLPELGLDLQPRT